MLAKFIRNPIEVLDEDGNSQWCNGRGPTTNAIRVARVGQHYIRLVHRSAIGSVPTDPTNEATAEEADLAELAAPIDRFFRITTITGLTDIERLSTEDSVEWILNFVDGRDRLKVVVNRGSRQVRIIDIQKDGTEGTVLVLSRGALRGRKWLLECQPRLRKAIAALHQRPREA